MIIMMIVIYFALVILGVFAVINHVRVSEMKTTLKKKNVVLNELVTERSFGDRVNRRLEDQVNTISQQLSLLTQQVSLLSHENTDLRIRVEASERRVEVMESVIRGYDDTRRKEYERLSGPGLRIVT
jgi:hypothetical protein